MTKPKTKNPPPMYSMLDRQNAARILREAAVLLAGGHPFPVLEAARREGVRTDSTAWELTVQARASVGGPRDKHQLEAAAALVEEDTNRVNSEVCSLKLTRIPRCRLHVPGGRCGRPVTHRKGCSPEPYPEDLVRSVGTDHVLVGGPPTSTTTIIAWETAVSGNSLRVRRDDHDRGFWFDYSSGQQRKAGKPLLLGWSELRRLVLDLNLALADHRDTPKSKKRLP